MGDNAQEPPGPEGAPAALRLEYRSDEQIGLTVAPPFRHVERWQVAVLADGASLDAQPVEIGYAHVLLFNLVPGDDIRDFADRASGTWIDNAPAGPAQTRVLGEAHGVVGMRSHVLVLDRVWVHPDARGQGLGPIIAAAVIERLGRGCHLAACYPAPFEDPIQQPDDRDRAIETLGKLWSRVGFTHWQDGVWMLDLDASDTHATLADVLAAKRRPPTNAQGGSGG